MKKILIILLFIVYSITAFTQDKPGNNLGKSVPTMQSEFPGLKYVKTDEKGDLYQYINSLEDSGIVYYFYFENGILVEESMIILGDDAEDFFPIMFFDGLWKTFSSKHPYAVTQNSYNYKAFDFGDFKIDFILNSENGIFNLFVVYKR